MSRNSSASRRLARYAAHFNKDTNSSSLFGFNGETTGGIFYNWEQHLNEQNQNQNEDSTNGLITPNWCFGKTRTLTTSWASASEDEHAVTPKQSPGFTHGSPTKSDSKITITSHILDINIGRPAANVDVLLERKVSAHSDDWQLVSQAKTDNDGRIKTFPPLPSLGSYRVVFKTGDYFSSKGLETPFYTNVTIQFEVRNHEHYHIPLLIAPHGYSTYRGS